MRFLKYIFGHKVAFFMVIILFVAQTVCDVQLPRYTSQIVDVGIQQSGIVDAVPEHLSTEWFQRIANALPSDERATFEASYEQDADGVWQYVPGDDEERAHLDEILIPVLISVVQGESALDTFEQPSQQQAIEALKTIYREDETDLLGIQTSFILGVGGFMLLVTLGSAVSHIIMNFFATTSAAKIGRDLRRRFFRKVVSFSEREVNRFSAASLITRGTNDIQLIQFMSLFLLRAMVHAPIMAVGGIVMIAQTNVSMGWIVAIAIVILIIFMIILMRITMPKFRLMQALIDKVNLVSREELTGVLAIRAFGRERYEEQRFDVASTDLLKTQLFTARAMSFMGPILTLFLNGISVIIVWIGSQFIDMGAIQVGDLIAFITYSMLVIASFVMLGVVAIMFPRASVASDRVEEVIVTSSSIADALEIMDVPAAAEGARIEFDDVSFAYDEGSANVLDHISFSVRPGQTLAVIGPTGSGKTTLVKLLMRFQDVTGGAVKLDGVDVRDIAQQDLHAAIGYVPQKSFLFTGTVRTNVAYGNPDMSDDEIREALDIAQALDFVDGLEGGLDAPISQGGTNVSGGQRQRLGIARAIATGARAFVFDDSFSALDYKTDRNLRAELDRRLGGKTVIIVAQRIATIMNADIILVLDEGKLVGKGTHAELMKTCDAYREIALSQLSEDELSKGVTANG